jgi:hypothetical protein
MAVITLIQIIQRFTDNFMKDPGALMFTLPVTVWALTASKAIAAFCMVLVSTLAVVASGFLYVVGTAGWSISIPSPIMDYIVYALVVCFMILQQICLIYAIITTSYMLPRFRVAAGCAMYLAIMYFLQETVFRLVRGGAIGYGNMRGEYAVMERGMHTYGDVSALSSLPTGIAALVLAVIFFWATGFLLKRSFNLE